MSGFTKADKHNWEPVNEGTKTKECTHCGMEISYPSRDWDEEIDNVCRVALKKTGNWRK